mgnify:CR=1 FL=1
MAGAVAIDLNGKAAIVTGGTRGLGRDIAAALAFIKLRRLLAEP